MNTNKRKFRVSRLAAVAGMSAVLLMGAGTGASAQAAEWPVPVPPRHIAVFPTWFGGPTTLCVTNLATAPGRYAKVRVTPGANVSVFDDVYANPGQRTCISRWWWGSPIVANNLSDTGATVRIATN